MGALAIVGAGFSILAFAPYVGLYRTIPAREIGILSAIIAAFVSAEAILVVSGPKAFPAWLFVLLALILGFVALGLLAPGGGLVVLYPVATGGAATIISLAHRPLPKQSLGQTLFLAAVASLTLLIPSAFFVLVVLPRFADPLVVKGLLGVGFDAALFGALYALTMTSLTLSMTRPIGTA